MQLNHLVYLLGVFGIVYGDLEQERTPASIRARAAKDDEVLYPHWHKSHDQHKSHSTESMDCSTASSSGTGVSISVSINITTVSILSTASIGPIPMSNASLTTPLSTYSYYTTANSTTVPSASSSIGPISTGLSITPTGYNSSGLGSSSVLPKYTNSTSPYPIMSSSAYSNGLSTGIGPMTTAKPTSSLNLSNSSTAAASFTSNTSISIFPTSSSLTFSNTIITYTTTTLLYTGPVGSSGSLSSYYSSTTPPYVNSSTLGAVSQSSSIPTIGTTSIYSSGTTPYTTSSVIGVSSGTAPSYYSSVKPDHTNSSSTAPFISQNSSTTGTGTSINTSSASSGFSSTGSSTPYPSSVVPPFTNSSTVGPVTQQTSTIVSSIASITTWTTIISLPYPTGIVSTVTVTETIISLENTTITVRATPTKHHASKPKSSSTTTSPIPMCNADNCLRAFRATQTPGRLSAAQNFCHNFTKTHDCAIPTYVPWECNSWRISSACSCIATSTAKPTSSPCPESEMASTSSISTPTSSASYTTVYATTTLGFPSSTSVSSSVAPLTAISSASYPAQNASTAGSYTGWSSSTFSTTYNTSIQTWPTGATTTSTTSFKLTGWTVPTDYFPHHPKAVRRNEASAGKIRKNFLRFPFFFSRDQEEDEHE